MVLVPPSLNVAVAVVVAALLASRWAVTRTPKAAGPQSTADGRPLREIRSLGGMRILVGDLFECLANATRFQEWLAETSLRCQGGPWRLRIPGQLDTVVFSTPDACEDVLVKQCHNFPKGTSASAVLEGTFGKAIVTFDGEQWHRQRQTAATFFTDKALRLGVAKAIHKNMLQMYEVLDKSVATGGSVELSNLLGQFALQTFVEVGLGEGRRWIGQREHHPLAGVAETVSPITMRRFCVPSFWWKLERFLGFGRERVRTEIMDDVREWLSTLVHQSLDSLAERHATTTGTAAVVKRDGEGDDDDGGDENAVKSVVELFVGNYHKELPGRRAEDLMDFIWTFIFSAQKTSATTLTWLFHVLTQRPDIEQRIRAEMAAVLPTLGVATDTYLTTEHVHHLVYLEATLREVLSLYPTVPLVQREVANDTVVCGDVPLKKGQRASLSVYAMARNPDVWGPDAAAFKPERMIDETTGELLSIPPTKLAAFGAGPRICIGMKLANMELRVVAANMIFRYVFAAAAPNDGSHVSGLTLLMKNPFIVTAARVATSA